MSIDLSTISRHCSREVRETLRALPDGGDWRLVKTKDHYFLYDGPARIACIDNNGSKPSEFIAKRIVRTVQKYVTAHYA